MMTWYDDAMRTIIDLTDKQIAALARRCAGEGLSRAEAIRRAVDEWLEKDRRAEREAAIRDAFGLWKDRGIDTDTYLRELREEWEERFPTT